MPADGTQRPAVQVTCGSCSVTVFLSWICSPGMLFFFPFSSKVWRWLSSFSFCARMYFPVHLMGRLSV